MEGIKRSDVWIPTWSGYALGIIRSQAKRKGKEYFASGPHGNCIVYAVKAAGVCTVSNLIDDRETR